MPRKHPNTERFGGPGSSKQDRDHPEKFHKDEGPRPGGPPAMRIMEHLGAVRVLADLRGNNASASNQRNRKSQFPPAERIPHGAERNIRANGAFEGQRQQVSGRSRLRRLDCAERDR
jgi:hypothetical protein